MIFIPSIEEIKNNEGIKILEENKYIESTLNNERVAEILDIVKKSKQEEKPIIKEIEKKKKPLTEPPKAPKFFSKGEPPKPFKHQIVKLAESKGYLFYIFPIINLSVIFVFIMLIIFVWKTINVWIFIFLILSFPILILSGLFLVVKLWLDFKKLKQFLIPVATSNFIIALFFTNNKRLLRHTALINDDGMSFDLADRTYLIDKKTIWFDEKRQPISFYFPELPNPIKFNPEKEIDKFMANIRKGELENNIDDDGELVDISFSSTNLQLYKKSKIFDELNKNPAYEKTQLAILGILALLIIALIIAIVV